MASRSDERKGALRRMLPCLPWVLLPVLLAVSLAVGRYPLKLHAVLRPGTLDRQVFFRLRFVRTGTVMLAGVSLSFAGSVFQTVFRNPLAAPDVAGVAAGAGTGAAAAILLFGAGSALVPAGAFVGGMLAVAAVLMLSAMFRSNGTVTLLMSGMVVNAVAQAATMLLKLSADTEQRLASIEYWMMGSFSAVTAERFFSVLPFAAAGIAAMMLLRRPVSLLSLSDDDAAMLGVRVPVIRAAALLSATLAVSAAVSASGLIAFVGLLAPHIARRLYSTGKPLTLLPAGAVGTDILLVSDILVRSVGVSEIPVGIATSLIGAAVLLLLAGRKGGAADA